MIKDSSQKEEIWKDIDGYDGLYQVSTYGNVRRVNPPCTKHKDTRYRLVKPVKWGMYLKVSLSKNNVHPSFPVHRLVAKTFIPNPECKKQVNHIDGNKENNCVDNLEWVTPLENNRHAFENGLNRYHPEFLPVLHGEDNPRHKLTESDVRKIKSLLKEGKLNQHEIASMFGVSNYAICDIKRGKNWKGVV